MAEISSNLHIRMTYVNMLVHILLQEMKLSVMKAQNQLQEYIALRLYSSVNLSSKLYMHQDGDKISIQENLLNFTILEHLLLLSFSTVRGRVALVEEPLDNYMSELYEN
jgi:hypothetical protein